MRAVCLRLIVLGLCVMPVCGCGGNDVDIETPAEGRQTLAADDQVVQLMRSPAERLIYDAPENLARPAAADTAARPPDTSASAADTTSVARDTAR